MLRGYDNSADGQRSHRCRRPRGCQSVRLRSHGAELVGEIAQYEEIYRLCFLRGPEGIIIGLAEQLS
jgi:hypothetical protein